MAYDYAPIRAKVSAKLKQYGILVTVRRSIGGTRNHGTGVYSGQTVESMTHYMLFQSPTIRDTGMSFIPGMDIKKEDRFAIMEVKEGYEVMIGDSVILPSKSYNVVNVQKVAPGDYGILYKIQLRV